MCVSLLAVGGEKTWGRASKNGVCTDGQKCVCPYSSACRGGSTRKVGARGSLALMGGASEGAAGDKLTNVGGIASANDNLGVTVGSTVGAGESKLRGYLKYCAPVRGGCEVY